MDNAETPYKTSKTEQELVNFKRNRCFRLYEDLPSPAKVPHLYSAIEVIQQVTNELNMVRKADTINVRAKEVKINLRNTKKSSFVPQHFFECCNLEQKKNNCETQGVTDTQMLDAADGADAVLQMINHKGMTQLFEVSVNNKEEFVNCHNKESSKHTIVNVNVSCNAVYDHVDKALYDNITLKEENKNDIFVTNNEISRAVKTSITDEEMFSDDNENMSLSPVLMPTVNVVKSCTEKENKQLKRKLSNLRTCENFDEPMNKISKNDSLSSDANSDHFKTETQSRGNDLCKAQNNIFDENINDHFIFSSDEEFGIETPKKFLPLTCKINNTYNPDTLSIEDKSLYVYFTTASEKSIQVSIDSFERAKKSFSFLERDLENQTDSDICTIEEPKTLTNNHKEIEELEYLMAVNKTKGLGDFQEAHSKLNPKLSKYTLRNQWATVNESQNNFERTSLSPESAMVCTEEINTLELSKTDKLLENVHCNGAENFLKTTQMDIKNGLEQDLLDGEPFLGFETLDVNRINKIKKALSVAIKQIDLNKSDIFKNTSLPNFQTKYRFKKKENSHENNYAMSPESLTKCKGFKALSNSTINLSKETLTKMENLVKVAEGEKYAADEGYVCVKPNIQELTNVEANYKYQDKSNTTEFQGFTTASNKPIKVSRQTLAKMANMFKDLDNETHVLVQKQPGLSTKFQEFTTINKTIKNQETTLAKTKNAFQDIGDKLKTFVQKQSKPAINIQECTTASNKAIEVPEQAWSETKNILDDMPENKPRFQTGFEGFKTARNKTIKNSEKALASTKKIFQGIGDEIIQELNPQFSTQCKGFITASNKAIKISEKAMANTKKIFQGIDDDLLKVDEHFKHLSIFQGFTTASNKAIKVSEKAIFNTKNIFQGIEDETKNIVREQQGPVLNGQEYTTACTEAVELPILASFETTNIFEDVVEKNPRFQTEYQGFNTASNKIIKVSEKALAFTKKKFQDIGDEIMQELNPQYKGFTTASNKEIKISEKSLSKTKNLFQGIDDEILNFGESSEHLIKFQGFKTASNKKIKVSKQALAITKTIFEDHFHENDSFGTGDFKKPETLKKVEQHENAVSSESKTRSSFQGFTTASNKSIKVTKEALATTRNIFREFDDLQHSQVENSVPESASFSIANNKSVNVSEKSLDKTKKYSEIIPSSYRSLTTGKKRTVKASDRTLQINKNLLETFGNTQQKSKDKMMDKENKNRHKESDKRKYDDMLNTQVKKNFEETLCSEDFYGQANSVQPTQNKSLGSPILPCSSAKRRKTNLFKVPYRLDSKIDLKCDKESNTQVKVKVNENRVYDFTENNNISIDKRIKLENIPRGRNQLNKSNKIEFPRFDLNNLYTFRFDKTRNDMTNSELDIKDLSEIFMNSVDKKIIPQGWLENHLKLILWKLLSYEYFFPESLAGVATVKCVLQQLKYRYNRDLNKVERPALRKILEKDEAPNKPIVLCVVRIFSEGQEVERVTNTTNLEMEVTDGWYCVRATIDNTLSKAILDGKIVSGTKILTHGAELLNCDQGKSPWEDTSSVRLKLAGNSTRRAAWWARLGAARPPPPLPLRHASPAGGRAAVRAHVARVYPLLYVERLADGSTVTRSERLEALQAARHEATRAARLEGVCEQVEREMSPAEEAEAGPEGTQMARAVRAFEQADCPGNLTDTQVQLVKEYTLKKRERLLEEIQKRIQEKIEKIGLEHGARNVVPLLKVRACGWHRSSKHSPNRTNRSESKSNLDSSDESFVMTKAIFSIWKPSEHLLDVIKEGVWIDAMNVVPTAVRMSETQISAGRNSVFRQSRQQDSENLASVTASIARKCTPISDLLHIRETVFNEVDTVGFVFKIEPDENEFDVKAATNLNFQNVYIADAEKNIICINFWGGLKKFGYDKVVEAKHFISCSNLQIRMGNSRKSMPQFRVTEFSTFTTVPRSRIAKAALEKLKNDFENMDLNAFCVECVIRSGINRPKDRGFDNVSPYRFNNLTEYNLSKHKVFIDSPMERKEPVVNKDDFNLTGLDFESTFKYETQGEEQALRKAKIESRIKKLKMYGDPPPLNLIHIDKSFRVDESFRSPILEGRETRNGVTSRRNAHGSVVKRIGELPSDGPEIAENRATSPFLPTSYVTVKSIVHPVKLNFDADAPTRRVVNNETDCSEACKFDQDNFSEEFDYSPPLSLDADFL